MTGKTHIAVGEAAALTLIRPANAKELVLCLGAAAVGALISDVDASASRSHRSVVQVTSLAGFVALFVALLDTHAHLGVLRLLRRQSSLWRVLLGSGAFLVVCNFGMRQPHRSFMHSVLGWVTLCVLVGEVFPALVPAFAVSMASHILLDLLNRKRVRLLYPCRWGWSLNLCPASGRINDLFCLTGTIVAGLGLVVSLWDIFL